VLRSVFFVIRYWGGYFRPDSRLRRFCCDGFCYVEVSSVSFGRGRAVGLRPVGFRFGTVS
jgi:hypothetical protein